MANPNHDEKGRFAESSGGPRGAKARKAGKRAYGSDTSATTEKWKAQAEEFDSIAKEHEARGDRESAQHFKDRAAEKRLHISDPEKQISATKKMGRKTRKTRKIDYPLYD